MTGTDPKVDLHHSLNAARKALIGKLDGLSEYDIRRPLTATGTNLLGLVKHLAGVEQGYFGDTFERPGDEAPLWSATEGEPNGDMWATADESREQVVERYRRAWAHSDETIDALPLDAVGRVPWWPEGKREVTLHRVMVLMVAEFHRHLGHADIVRELIDGTVGMRFQDDQMATRDATWWADHRDRLERVARDAGDRR